MVPRDIVDEELYNICCPRIPHILYNTEVGICDTMSEALKPKTLVRSSAL